MLADQGLSAFRGPMAEEVIGGILGLQGTVVQRLVVERLW